MPLQWNQINWRTTCTLRLQPWQYSWIIIPELIAHVYPLLYACMYVHMCVYVFVCIYMYTIICAYFFVFCQKSWRRVPSWQLGLACAYRKWIHEWLSKKNNNTEVKKTQQLNTQLDKNFIVMNCLFHSSFCIYTKWPFVALPASRYKAKTFAKNPPDL